MKTMDEMDERTILEKILDSLPFEVFVKDRESRYVYVNRFILENDGLSEEEIIGKRDVDIYPVEFSQMFEATDREVIERGKTLKFSERNIDGSILYIQKKPFKNSEGEIIGVLGYSPDISEEFKENLDLKREISKYKGIFEKATIGIAIYDTPTFTAKSFNNAFTEMLGRSAEELLTLPWEAYSHPAEVQENHDYMDKLIKGTITGFQMEKRYIRSDNSIIWVHMTITKYEDEENKNSHLVMVSDITERKKAEEEVLFMASHDRLTGVHNRMAFENYLFALDRDKKYPISIITIDVNGLKLINDAMGHAEGDNSLKKLSAVIKRVTDYKEGIGRVGGDEFMIALPETDSLKTMEIMERIKKELEKEEGLISVAMGYATKTDDKQSITDIIQIADSEMYQDKRLNGWENKIELIDKIIKRVEDVYPSEAKYKKIMTELAEKISDALGYSEKTREDLLSAVKYWDIGKVRAAGCLTGEDSYYYSNNLISETDYHESGYYILRYIPGFEDTACIVRNQDKVLTGQEPLSYPELSKVLGIIKRFAEIMYLEELPAEKALNILGKNVGGNSYNKELFIKLKDIMKNVYGKHN